MDTSHLLASYNYNTNTPHIRQEWGYTIRVDTSRLLASHNYNTPTNGRRGATLSTTYLGGHLTFTSIIQHQYTNTPTFGRRGATLSATYLGGHLTSTSIIQLQYQHTTHPVGVGLHYQLPIWVDTSHLLASYNYNTNTPHSR